MSISRPGLSLAMTISVVLYDLEQMKLCLIDKGMDIEIIEATL
jgi:hypothetical protein